MKASVYKQYGDAAIMNIVLESLPKVRLIKDYMLKLLNNPFFIRSPPKLPHHWLRPKKLFLSVEMTAQPPILLVSVVKFHQPFKLWPVSTCPRSWAKCQERRFKINMWRFITNALSSLFNNFFVDFYFWY